MHKVPEARLHDGQPDTPFMLSWANEPWTRRWDGGGQGGRGAHTLINQSYGGPEEWERHFAYLQQFWRHPKYICINGRPLFVIYRVGHFPTTQLGDMLRTWRRLAEEWGVPAPHLLHTVGNFYTADDTASELKAGLEGAMHGSIHFWPQLLGGGLPDGWVNQNQTASTGNLDTPIANREQFWGAYFGFDRRVRAPDSKTYPLTPAQVRVGLRQCFANMSFYSRPNDNFLFLTAWNEWNEQATLEPDHVYGDGMLRALRDSLRSVPVRVVFGTETQMQ